MSLNPTPTHKQQHQQQPTNTNERILLQQQQQDGTTYNKNSHIHAHMTQPIPSLPTVGSGPNFAPSLSPSLAHSHPHYYDPPPPPVFTSSFKGVLPVPLHLNTIRDYRKIDFADLDKEKFYLYMPMCTFVVRCLSHPMNVIKTRMQTTINTVSSATPAAPSTASPYSAATTSNSASTGGTAKPRIIPYRRMPVDLTKKTTLGAFKHILEYEGIRGLYAGFGMAIWGLAIGPVYLTSVEKTKSFLYNSTDLFHKNRTSVLPFDVVPFLSGASASVVSQLMGVPLDVIQNNQMKQDSTAIGGHRRRRALDVIREVREKSGISGFYRGYWVTLMQNAPMSALVWFTFAEIHPRLSKLPIAAKRWISTISSTSPSTALTPPPSSTPIIPPSITLPPTIHHHSPTPPLNTSSLSTTFPSSSSSSVSSSPHLSSHHDHLPGKWDVTELGVVFVSAALAGGFASVMTLPLDVLRTRLQTSMNPNATVVSTFHDIRQQRGWSGFMSGSRPRLFGQAMSAATLMTVYEILKRVCLREDDQHDGHKHQHV